MRKNLLKLFFAACFMLVNAVSAVAANLPTAKELVKTWSTTRTVFNLTNNKSICYLLDYDSPDGFAHDDDGKYISMSVKEYCEQFANDWNADSANEQKITTEEAADRTVTGNDFVNFVITDNRFTMKYGYGPYYSTNVDGTYTYDEETGIITVNDEIEKKAKQFIVSIDQETNAVVFYNFTEWYPLSIMSYDQTKDYFIFAPTYYYCDKYEPVETGINEIASEKTETARYTLNGVQAKAGSKGVNIIKMSDGSTRKVLVK